MFGAFTSFGKLGSLARAIAAAWSPLSLWPNGILSPGMWISPRTLDSHWQDYTGTTPVVTPGTVADSSNPVGLALDIRAGATVLTDPGNHLFQATSTARPLVSARVNLLTYTEDFTNWDWVKDNVSLSAPSTTNGVTTTQVTATAANGRHQVARYMTSVVGAYYISSVYVKAGTATRVGLLPINNAMWYNYSSDHIAVFDLDSGTVVSAGTWNEATITPAENGGYVLTVRDMRPAPFSSAGFAVVILGPGDAIEFLASGTETVHIGWPQVQLGTTATPYQPILTDGSTYPATGFPIYQKYDGTDDGMATATFAAGTLSNAMDCMIPVRRDSGTIAVAGLSSRLQNIFFGIYVQGENVDLTHHGCGTPVPWVDGVELTGGTSATRGTLYNALTAGEWHILEYRGLDLSAWTKAEWGNFGENFFLNGARGDIFLFPSTASTADKDAARQWLADYYGVTLP